MVFASPELYIMSGPTLTRQVRQLLNLPTLNLFSFKKFSKCRADHARLGLICMKLRETEVTQPHHKNS